MEMLSHFRSVWYNIFKLEVLDFGRPIPGCSIALSPRPLGFPGLGQAKEYLEEDDGQERLRYALSEMVRSRDFEARTLHALRLERRWAAAVAECKSRHMKFGRHPTSKQWSFRIPGSVHGFFLLPGGRYAISVGHKVIRCWDLGFPQQKIETEGAKNVPRKTVECVGEFFHTWDISTLEVFMDANTRLVGQDEGVVNIVGYENVNVEWRYAEHPSFVPVNINV